MKVLFLIPPAGAYLQANNARVVERDREPRPWLGLLCVASYLQKEKPAYSVRFVDASSGDRTLSQIGELVREFAPDVAGMSALTFTLLDSLAAARVVKEASPSTRVVLGGWHPTHYPRETLKQPVVDYVVCGEGEVTFAELCDRLADDPAKPALQDLTGIAYRTPGGEIVVNPPRPPIEDLDRLPPPDYDLPNIHGYRHVLGGPGVTVALQSSRGCPFRCSFCDIRRTPFRQHSPERIVDQIRRWRAQGVRSFFFVDDNFVIDRRWLTETCELLARTGLDFEFKISARVDLLTLETCRSLKRAGCARVNLGVESSRQEHLDFIDKGIRVEQSGEAFRVLHQAGIKGFAHMIVGFPGQTSEEMYAEPAFLRRIGADFAGFSVLSAFPKTELYGRLLAEGFFPGDFWQDYAENPMPDFVMPLVSRLYDSRELRRLQASLIRRFYCHPSFLLRTATSIRSLRQLRDYASMGFRIIRNRL